MLLLTVLGLALTVSTVNGACVASYKKYELKHVAGGTSQGTTANTLTLCQAACDGNNKCAGYDFTNANVCWLVLNPDTPITDDAKADHYRRITTCTKAEAICVYEYIGPYSATTLQAKTGDLCSDDCNGNPACKGFFTSTVATNPCNTLSDVATGVRTEVATNTLYKQVSCNIPRSAVCNAISYFEMKDKHVSGGKVDASGSASVTACQGVCSPSTACIGIDYVPGSSNCYIITNPKAAVSDQTGTNNYAAQRECTTGGTTCKYQRTGSYVPSGTKSTKTASQTFDQCATLCNNDGGCTQFAYNAKTQDCVTSTGTTTDTTANADNTMYTKTTPCPATTTSTAPPTTTSTTTVTTVSTGTTTPGCVNVFTETKDRSSIGGMQDGSAKTVDACKKVCADTAACVAFDFVVSSNQCWINKDIKNLDDVRTSSGINQYKIERCVKVCNPAYASKEKTSSMGGIKSQVTISVLDDCKKVCTDDKACLGFDFGPGTQCWIHSDAEKFKVKKTSTESTQYTITRCDATSDTTTSVGTTVTTTAGCKNEFKSTASRASSGGVRDNSVTTLEACKNNCAADDKCVGFDYTTTNQCWIHPTKDNLQKGKTTTGVTQYEIVRCVDGTTTTAGTTTLDTTTGTPACINKFTPTAGRSSTGGVRNNAANTVDLCKKACGDESKCVAFDYITSSNQCWLHNAIANLNDERSTADSTQYKIQRCVQPCKNEFKSTPSRSSDKAVLKSSATTLEACKALCVADEKCVGFDYTTSNQCWIHENKDNFNDQRNTADSTQYVIERCVDGATTTATPTGTGGTTGTPGCVPSWDAGAKSTSSSGGVRKATLGSLQQCQVGCVVDKACLAIDFSSTGCYFHLNADFKNNRRSTDATSTQYILTRCAATGCPEFKEYKDVHASGGIPNAAADTLAKCQDVCDKNSDCKSIDYTAGGSIKCYILTMEKKPGTSDLSTLVGTNHYTLICRTGQTKPTAAPTPTIPACINQWAVTASTHSGGGKFNGAGRTLVSCRKLCADDANCLAIDFNDGASPKECWIHTDATSLAVKRTSDPNINQNIISRCTGCTPSFTKTDDVHGKGGKLQTGVNTLAACQANCVALASCVALDFTDANACWFFEAAGYATEADTANTHYVIKRCTDASTTPAGGTTRAPCVTYEGSTNMKASGGFIIGVFTDLDSCKNGCSSSPGCFGINFLATAAANQRCELVFSSSGVASASGYTYYAASRCDATTTQAATTSRAP